MSEPSTLGERVAAIRNRRGWTQKKLADEAGLSATFISEVENDKRNIGYESLLRISETLGASLDYLAKGKTEESDLREPLVLPAELAQAADKEGWSVGHAADLLKARRLVVERRTKSGRGSDESDYSVNDWIQFHKTLFEDE